MRIEHLAHQLNTAPGNLVDYGNTVIVKPGSLDLQGNLLTGHTAAAALAGTGLIAGPTSVTYRPERPASLSQIGAEMEALEEEVDAFGARPGQIARLHRRYTRLAARYRKTATLALLPRRGRAKRQASLLMGRLHKVWGKMQAKGVPTSALTSPGALAAQVNQGVNVLATRIRARQSTATAAPAWNPQPYADPGYAQTVTPAQSYADPGYAQPAPDLTTYVQDQQALEAELARIMPTYGADEDHDDLVDDLRGDVVGFELSDLENDHFGLANTNVELLFSDPDDVESLADDDDDLDATAVPRASGRDDEDEDEGEDGDEEDPVSDVDRALSLVSSSAAALSKKDKRSLARTRGRAARRGRDRHRVNPGRVVSDVANTGRTLLPLVQMITDRLGAEAPHGGVDYARLIPSRAMRADPVFLIGITRRSWSPPSGLGDLTPLQAMRAHRAHLGPSELISGPAIRGHHGMGGSQNTAWPLGDDAPLPPPRRPGPEVFGA